VTCGGLLSRQEAIRLISDWWSASAIRVLLELLLNGKRGPSARRAISDRGCARLALPSFNQGPVTIERAASNLVTWGFLAFAGQRASLFMAFFAEKVRRQGAGISVPVMDDGRSGQPDLPRHSLAAALRKSDTGRNSETLEALFQRRTQVCFQPDTQFNKMWTQESHTAERDDIT